MNANAYQQVLRNGASWKPAEQLKVRTSDAARGWFAHYASLLEGIWGKDTAPFV
jgi:hypothetical protein